MRVLVTGAGGFLGRAVVRALRDHAIRAHAGPPGAPGPADWARADVEAIGSLVSGVDAVVHLAGPPSVADSFARPVEHARAHVVGTAALVAALPAGTRLVYVSSAEVYGRPARNPVAEDAPLRPVSPYGAAKVGAEAVIGAAGVSAVVLRPFCVYGPRGAGVVGHVLRQLADPAARAVELADLRPVRDFCHVDDVAAAIRAAVEGEARGAFNVGSGRGVSIGALAEAAVRAAGRPLPIVERPERRRAADVMEMVADVGHIERALGWRARIGLEEGLRS